MPNFGLALPTRLAGGASLFVSPDFFFLLFLGCEVVWLPLERALQNHR